MSLDRDDVVKIAHLARLAIDEADIPRYARELSNILALVEQMNQVDTSGIEPLSNPHDATQRLRSDEVTEPDQRESFQAIAPDVEDGLYRVPRVIE